MSVKNHIHINDMELKAVDRKPSPSVVYNVTEGVTGKRHVSVRTFPNGEPAVQNDWMYKIKATRSQYYDLLSILGSIVEFLDHDHEEGDTGALMRFVSISNVKNVDPVLNYYHLDIKLIELESYHSLGVSPS